MLDAPLSSCTDEEILARRAAIEAPLSPERYSTLLRLVHGDGHRVVVTFGGGSLPGLAGNLALARILEELDLKPRVCEVWGTSAGAVIGSGWATGTPALRILELTRGLARGGSLDFGMFRFAIRILASLWPLRRPIPDGLATGKHFLRTIEAGLRVDTFEECELPFRCIAVSDDGEARRKVFRRGPLLPAVFASMSLPGIIMPQPVPQDGRAYYDGGLVEKTPLLSPIAEHATSGDRRKLLLLGTHFANAAAGPARGFHNRFLTTLDALENLAWDYQLKEARARPDTVLLLLNPQLRAGGMFDFSRTDALYLAARAAFTDVLQNANIARTFGTS